MNLIEKYNNGLSDFDLHVGSIVRDTQHLIDYVVYSICEKDILLFSNGRNFIQLTSSFAGLTSSCFKKVINRTEYVVSDVVSIDKISSCYIKNSKHTCSNCYSKHDCIGQKYKSNFFIVCRVNNHTVSLEVLNSKKYIVVDKECIRHWNQNDKLLEVLFYFNLLMALPLWYDALNFIITGEQIHFNGIIVSHIVMTASSFVGILFTNTKHMFTRICGLFKFRRLFYGKRKQKGDELVSIRSKL